MEEMTIKEIIRLLEWLEANGISDAKKIECVNFIGDKPELKKDSSPTKEKGIQ